MEKQEISTGWTDAPNGITPPTDDTAVINGGLAESIEGEEHRSILLLSWKPTPTDYLAVGENETQDVVPEATDEGL